MTLRVVLKMRLYARRLARLGYREDAPVTRSSVAVEAVAAILAERADVLGRQQGWNETYRLNREGWTFAVRWPDLSYVKLSDLTQVANYSLSVRELRTAWALAERWRWAGAVKGEAGL